MDHARNLEDLPEGEDGPEEGAGPRGSVPARLPAGPAIDPETARELLPYLRNSRKLAPPSKAQKAKAKLRARLGGLGEGYEAWRKPVLDAIELSLKR